MAESHDILGKKDVSRRDFMKLMGAGTLAVGVGVFRIPNVLKNIKPTSITVPNSGHWIADGQPDVVVKLLNNFFRDNSTTSGG